MRKTVLAILSGVAIVLSTLALVPNEAAAQKEEEASGVAADLEAVVSGAADSAVVFGAADLEWGCPAGLEAGSPAAGSGAWAGRVDLGAAEAGDGGGAGDGASLLRWVSVAWDGAVAGAIRMVAGAGAAVPVWVWELWLWGVGRVRLLPALWLVLILSRRAGKSR